MQIESYRYNGTWNKTFDTSLDSQNTLVLLFGSSNKALVKKPIQELAKNFQNSSIMGASTAGEIFQEEVYEDSIVAVVMRFATTQLKLVTKEIHNNSFHLGKEMATELASDALAAIFILSDGLHINGSQLTDGFNTVITPDVTTSGGLASDKSNFVETWIVVNGEVKSNFVSAIGFYGKNIRMGYGTNAGWDILGIKKRVTKSQNNRVYTLDNKPILDIYKKYLGEQAKDLPASGLLFPLGVYTNEAQKTPIIRTVLTVDEEEKSITFAGDIPEGARVCLMKSNNDKLISAALDASQDVNLEDYTDEPLVNIAISCIGRKLVLKQRVEEELEAAVENLPAKTLQVGFYSYGEISPSGLQQCDLHNQTMTLTTIWEKDA